MKHRAPGVNPNVKQTNGAVAVFDHGGWVDREGSVHCRRRSHTCEALKIQLRRGRGRGRLSFKARLVNIRQLGLRF